MRDDLNIPLLADGPSYRVARPRAAMEPNTRRLALIAGGIGAALVLLIGVYTLAGHRHPATIPVVEADPRPLRVKPANPGGLDIAGADESILSGAAIGKEAMAPAPEVPAPQALQAQATPAPGPVQGGDPAAAQPVSLAPVAPPAAPLPVTAAPETRPARPAAVPRPAAPAPTAAGTAQVQLAALPTEEGATAEWQRLAKRMPDLLGGRKPAVSRTEHDGRVFFRLRTGGFADIAQATAFCQRVREKGGGCSIASF